MPSSRSSRGPATARTSSDRRSSAAWCSRSYPGPPRVDRPSSTERPEQMRYWFFSETAYPDLPPEASYESVRVTLPNRLLDPERAASWWDEYLAEWQAA